MLTSIESCVSTNISILVYGESGSGKTSLVKTLPNQEKVLVINAENGLRSIMGSAAKVFDLTKDKKSDGTIYELSRVERYAKLMGLVNDLKNNSYYRENFDWLVFDSLTEMSQNLVESMKQMYPDPKDTFKIWGGYAEMLTDFIKNIRDLAHFNSLIIALDAVKEDESNVRYTGIDVQGKISSRLPALLDEIFYLKKYTDENGEDRRTFLTSTYKNIIAKDRSNKLEQFEQPSIGYIYDKIHS